MRIGILTFHKSINYGAYMQCLALSYEVAKRFPSSSVEVVNYSSLKMEKNYKVKFNRSMLKHPLEYPYRKARIKVFASAQNYLPLSDCYIIEDSCENVFQYIREHYDVIIVGSDAVFNWIKRGFPNPYLLDMGAEENNPIRLSYAASAFGMGMEHVTDERREIFGNSLSHFKFIGVRDDYTKTLVKYCCNEATPVFTCDPTAFLDLDYVYSLLGQTKETFKEYFFKKYHLNPNKRLICIMGTSRTLVKRLKQEYGKTHTIVAVYSATGAEDKYLYNIPPLEWALLFGLCDITLTNFFHGTLLSIRNGTPVISIEHTSFGAEYKGKMQDVQERMCMDDCFFSLSRAKADNWQAVIDKVDELLSDETIRDTIECNRMCLCSSCEPFFDKLGKILGEENIRKFSQDKASIIRNQVEVLRNPSTLATDRSACTGCRLCEKVCPQGAISFSTENGFMSYSVDKDKCVGCTLCNKVCPVAKEQTKKDPISVWALRDKDNESLLCSSSGGAFGLIARNFIFNGGVVSGVAYTNDIKATHKIAHTLDDVKDFHGSKYVQADMANIYFDIEEELKSGKKVLASGTPCQIAAIKSYFGDKYPNLYTLDLICHGVQSQTIFEEYIKELEAENGKKIVDFKFRDKTNGWKKSNVKIVYKDNTFDIMTRAECEYFNYFNYLRPSCYHCHFRGFNNKSDITIGDYWGIESLSDEFNDDKGVSIALVHTSKGTEMLSQLSNAEIIESNLEHALKTHAKLKKSIPVPPHRDKFFSTLENCGYRKARKYYLNATRLYRTKVWFKRKMKK